jgi:hypothetical protein
MQLNCFFFICTFTQPENEISSQTLFTEQKRREVSLIKKTIKHIY